MGTVTTWKGQSFCDLCGCALKDQTWFVDGRTRMGPWAVMCPADWMQHGVTQLGTGYGQMYDGATFQKVKG